MLVAEHELLVTQVEKLADPWFHSGDKEDWLSDLSYGAPPRTSSGLSFHGGASPIPIPVPAPTSALCQGHSSLDAPSELNPPQRIPSPLSLALLVPQAEG